MMQKLKIDHETEKATHLYIHIPFCEKRCGYCDFLTSTRLAELDNYLDYLTRELTLLSQRYPTKLATVYIGGGTPSLLSAYQFERLSDCLHQNFSMEKAEFSVEVNPESISYSKAMAYVSAKVNRVSMGMQAVAPELLKVLDRQASAPDVRRAVNYLVQAGITNYSLDLIYGIPGQRLSDIGEALDFVRDVSANHVATYALKVEKGTALARRVQRGELTIGSDDASADAFDMICARLSRAHYHRYEISNFAKTGFESAHNSAYWRAANTLAAGLGAVYLWDDKRYYNLRSFKQYYRAIDRVQLPYDRVRTEVLSADDKLYEYLILGLRTARGIDSVQIERRFNVDFKRRYRSWIDKYADYGVLKRQGSRYYLSQHGLNIAHYILSDL